MKHPTFLCNLWDEATALPHFWEHTVGSGHAPLAWRGDRQHQLQECRTLLGFRHTRFHGLMCDEMGTLMDEKSELLYSFFNADQICDFLLSIGMKPFVELSFMPTALATGGKTVFHYGANVTPPKDSANGRRLCPAWRPTGSSATASMKSEPGSLRSGTSQTWRPSGPELRPNTSSCTAGLRWRSRPWTGGFRLADRRQPTTNGSPSSSTSAMKTACRSTSSARTTIPMMCWARSAKIPRRSWPIAGAYPAQWAQDTHRKARGKPVYYTEWSSSSNPRDHLHDEPYTAAVIVKTMMEAAGLVQGYSFWTFTDIFEENYMPATAFQGGFGLLTLQGRSEAILSAFELLHRLGTEALPVSGTHDTVDVWVVRGYDSVTVLLTNHVLPRHPIKAEPVQIQLTGLLPPRGVYVERIDDEHANAKALWIEMGGPVLPKPREVEQLRTASQIVREPQTWRHEGDTLHLEVTMPAHSIAAVTVELTRRPGREDQRPSRASG